MRNWDCHLRGRSIKIVELDTNFMPAPKGNKNAIGNKGGKTFGKDNREKAATLKGLVIDECIRVMNSEDNLDKDFRKQIVLRLATNCIPQVVQGDNESPLVVKVINYGNNYTPPIQSQNISVKVPTSTSTIQNSGLAQEGWQVQDGAERTDKKDPA